MTPSSSQKSHFELLRGSGMRAPKEIASCVWIGNAPPVPTTTTRPPATWNRRHPRRHSGHRHTPNDRINTSRRSAAAKTTSTQDIEGSRLGPAKKIEVSEMSTVTQWVIILLVIAFIAGIGLLNNILKNLSSPPARVGWQPWPADSLVRWQQLAVPGMPIMAYIGPGGWASAKYWVCSGHYHHTGEEALACAQNHLDNAKWDGRVLY